MWIAELSVYHYKARMYHPRLGGFMQTDPSAYAGGMNLYGYVSGDPINASDPWGLREYCWNTGGTSSIGITDSFGNAASSSGPFGIRTCIDIPDFAPGPSFGGGGGGVGVGSPPESPPQSVSVNRSCGSVSAASDPNVQQTALSILSEAIKRDAEVGFWAVRIPMSSSHLTLRRFTSGDRLTIAPGAILAWRPNWIDWFSLDATLVHTHQYGNPPRPASRLDQGAADVLGSPIIAIDRAKTFDCVTPRPKP
jgi:hypothetical protein